jgi:chromate transporter
MQRMVVDELRWIGASRFLAALNFCMLLPGPEAQQLAAYIGWCRAGWRGALVSGGLFVLPGTFVMLVLSAAYVEFGSVPAVEGLFLGVKCALVAIVVEALLRIARRALVFRGARWVAVAAFASLYGLAAPYPAIVATAAALGWIIGCRGAESVGDDFGPSATDLRTNWMLVGATALAWAIPLGLLLWLRGADDRLSQIGLLYSELALVTFGGAYAVLSYVTERAVSDYGWLSVLTGFFAYGG